MKHVMLDSSFTYESGIVRGFRHAHEIAAESVLIPACHVEPITFYDVVLNDAQGTVILSTPNLAAAESEMKEYNADPNHESTRAEIRTSWELTEDRFRVVQRRDEGEGVGVAILRGTDETQRVFAFIGCDGDASRVDLTPEKSNATILLISCDRTSNHHSMQAVAIMDIGARLVFTLSETNKPNDKRLRIYTWTGHTITDVTIPEYQWNGYLTQEVVSKEVGSIPDGWTQM